MLLTLIIDAFMLACPWIGWLKSRHMPTPPFWWCLNRWDCLPFTYKQQYLYWYHPHPLQVRILKKLDSSHICNASCQICPLFFYIFTLIYENSLRWDLGIWGLNLGFRDLRFNLRILAFGLRVKDHFLLSF